METESGKTNIEEYYMFSKVSKRMFALVLVGVLLVGVPIGWLITRGQAQPKGLAPDGSIPIPVEMVNQFKATTGEDLNRINEDYKALQERGKRLEPFFIQLRMNILQNAEVPVNQYEMWRLDTEKKALVKVDPKTGQPAK